MQTIPQQEADDLAHSLPWEQSQLWGSAIFMVVVLLFTLWLLNRNDETPKQLPTLLEVEASRNPNWLSQWGMGLGLLVYSLGITLIGWQVWRVYLA